jgi:hypothetical protein
MPAALASLGPSEGAVGGIRDRKSGPPRKGGPKGRVKAD